MDEIKQALMPFVAFAEHAIENVNGTWVWKNNTQNERICDWFGPSDFGAALPSAAVAEREPVAFPECVLGLIDGEITLAFETPDDAQTAFDIIEHTISDPPPTSELEALRKERDEWRDRSHRTHELLLAADEAKMTAEARLAEALKALEPFADARMIARLEAENREGISNFGTACCVSVPTVIGCLYDARRVREGGNVDG